MFLIPSGRRLIGHHEVRRRILRRALKPLFRRTDLRLRSTKDLDLSEIRRILICRPNHRLVNLLLRSALIMECQRSFPDA